MWISSYKVQRQSTRCETQQLISLPLCNSIDKRQILKKKKQDETKSKLKSKRSNSDHIKTMTSKRFKHEVFSQQLQVVTDLSIRLTTQQNPSLLQRKRTNYSRTTRWCYESTVCVNEITNSYSKDCFTHRVGKLKLQPQPQIK